MTTPSDAIERSSDTVSGKDALQSMIDEFEDTYGFFEKGKVLLQDFNPNSFDLSYLDNKSFYGLDTSLSIIFLKSFVYDEEFRSKFRPLLKYSDAHRKYFFEVLSLCDDQNFIRVCKDIYPEVLKVVVESFNSLSNNKTDDFVAVEPTTQVKLRKYYNDPVFIIFLARLRDCKSGNTSYYSRVFDMVKDILLSAEKDKSRLDMSTPVVPVEVISVLQEQCRAAIADKSE